MEVSRDKPLRRQNTAQDFTTLDELEPWTRLILPFALPRSCLKEVRDFSRFLEVVEDEEACGRLKFCV